ncbi:MAG: type II toxin-antitoxin system RelB/DinJ family antitoxin [Defluviitaleaceae bacterium]|nr:type II toxin-antitoxin system RelB/DinJ family antitoxin [Defluviitaleaceae bacterium]MCL2239285.1 type II toxin-antitoxin system RelB/DinJ family antitoxin [Defluviitaleaceae bacterium]
MSKAITVRVDETIKQRAEETLDEIGLNMTTYIVSSLKALVREQKVPFELTTKQQANANYIAKLDDSIAQAERGEVVMYTKAQMRAMEKTQ